MHFLKYLIRRLLETIPVLFVISLLVFLMIHMIPGDPAVVMLGGRATPQALENLRVEMGFKDPLYIQYFHFLKNIFSLNLGNSIYYHVPVFELIGSRFGVTLNLILYTALIAIALTVPLAIYSADHRNQVGDQLIRVLGLVGICAPGFWLAILLMLAFSIKIPIFPVGGYSSGFWNVLKSLFLPAFTLSLGMVAILVRSLRSSLIDVLKTDYVAFARVKGISKLRLLVTHVLRSGLISTVTLLGVNLSWLVGGTLAVEKVFALPGIGVLMIDSISSRDYPVVQGVTLVFALLVVLINILTDLSYSMLDPRVSLE
jgi:peptide/nickel transport system permease protein